MNTEVDLSKLAIDREQPKGQAQRPRHLGTRYVLPATLVVAFFVLLAWAARDSLLPARSVSVVPVLATRAEVQREGTPLFKAAGWVEPRPTPIRVAALAPGVVDRLLVVEDQTVKSGQPVAELIDADAKLLVDRALADLKLREAEMDQAEAVRDAAVTRLQQPVHLEAELGEAQAALAKVETQLVRIPFETRRAQARLNLTKSKLEAKTDASGVVSGLAIDQARSEFEEAQALLDEQNKQSESVEKERAGLIRRRDALQKQLELKTDETRARNEAEAQIEVARARVDQARIALSEAKLQLDRMTVRSPVDGRVLRLVATPGTRLMIVSGHTSTHDGTTVVTLYQPDQLQVRVDARFEDIPHVRRGQPALINSPAISAALDGEVLFVSSRADIQKNTLEVKVAIPSPPPVFKPEMLVDVTFLEPPALDDAGVASTQELRLYVPTQLVQQSEDGPFVWVADQSERAARRVAVETGSSQAGGLVEITKGLTVGSRLIVTGLDGLHEGARIQITEEENGLAVSTTSVDLAADGR